MFTIQGSMLPSYPFPPNVGPLGMSEDIPFPPGLFVGGHRARDEFGAGRGHGSPRGAGFGLGRGRDGRGGFHHMRGGPFHQFGRDFGPQLERNDADSETEEGDESQGEQAGRAYATRGRGGHGGHGGRGGFIGRGGRHGGGPRHFAARGGHFYRPHMYRRHGDRSWPHPMPFHHGFPFEHFTQENLSPDGQIRPLADIYEKAEEYIIEIELPGVNKEDVVARIGEDGKSIVVEGKAGEEDQTASEQQIVAERALTRGTKFARMVLLLGKVDPQNVVADLKDGVLKIKVSKAQADGVRVEIA